MRVPHGQPHSYIRTQPPSPLAHLGLLRLLPPVLDVPVEDARHVDLGGRDLIAQEAHVLDGGRKRRLGVRELLSGSGGGKWAECAFAGEDFIGGVCGSLRNISDAQ